MPSRVIRAREPFLPFSSRQAAKKEQAAQASEKLDDFQGAGRVLVVDDEEEIRNLAEMVLENYGYSVFTAGNGEEALDFLENSGESVDMLVVDVVMPKMGGGELVKKVRSQDKSIKILFTSGYLDDRISENLDPEVPGHAASQTVFAGRAGQKRKKNTGKQRVEKARSVCLQAVSEMITPRCD
ncbi:MAG: response regulator [candidate division KSB1 bacterium]|nr:response regulator [candidate division KSB1 bacterium]